MEYKSLREEDDEIRLLKIIDNGSEPIACTIEHVSLRASPSYRALSYCWGDASNTKAVSINGREVAVTVNLEIALRQLRGEDYGWIWIDALCINQRDLKERGAQVLRMGDLYSKATEVIAWLGPEQNNSTTAMEFIEVLAQNAQVVDENVLDIQKPISAEKCMADDVSSWSALRALFGRNYWTRLWVIQETALARKVVFRCGAARTSDSNLMIVVWIALRRMWYAAFIDDSSLLAKTFLLKIYHLFCCRTTAARHDILRLIHLTQGHYATDLRDYLYGTLALSHAESLLVGRPRYDEPVEELYIRFTTSLISTRTELDFICFKPSRGNGLQTPSWVMDISQPLFANNPPWTLPTDIPLIWKKQGTLLEKPKIVMRPENEGSRILQIAGLRIDMVDGFGVNQEGFGGDTIVQPDNTRNAYFSDHGMRTAIISCIWTRLEDSVTADLIDFGWKKLWQLQSLAPVLPNAVTIEEWKEQNRDLLIAGRRLEDWALLGPDDLSLEELSKLPTDLQDMYLANDQLLLNSIHGRLSRDLNWHRKFLITSKGYVANGHAQTKKGDLVCILQNCDKGVLLRPTADGIFRIIGDAEVVGFEKGSENFLNLQKEIDEGRTETFNII